MGLDDIRTINYHISMVGNLKILVIYINHSIFTIYKNDLSINKFKYLVNSKSNTKSILHFCILYYFVFLYYTFQGLGIIFNIIILINDRLGEIMLVGM